MNSMLNWALGFRCLVGVASCKQHTSMKNQCFRKRWLMQDPNEVFEMQCALLKKLFLNIYSSRSSRIPLHRMNGYHSLHCSAHDVWKSCVRPASKKSIHQTSPTGRSEMPKTVACKCCISIKTTSDSPVLAENQQLLYFSEVSLPEWLRGWT